MASFRLSTRDNVSVAAHDSLPIDGTAVSNPTVQSHLDHHQVIEIVQAIIAEHFHRADLYLLLEHATGLSISRLRSVIRGETGVTLGKLIDKIRIDRAKELLLATDCKCYCVGVAIGMRDETHFSRWFKHITGMTPAEFRDHKSSPAADCDRSTAGKGTGVNHNCQS